MKTITVFGIHNCDTIKKTLIWLNSNHINVEFHDYKIMGITTKKLTLWCKMVNWEILLNKKSTTWKGLPAEVQKKVNDQTSAIKVMVENNRIIKRPVIECGDVLVVGFNENEFNKAFL